MQHPPKVEHYKSDIEDQEYQIKRYQRFNLKPNQENVGSVSKSRRLVKKLPAGVELLPLQRAATGLDLAQLLTELGHRQINEIWCEAGATLGADLLQEQLIDELIVYQAAHIAGAPAAPMFNTQTIIRQRLSLQQQRAIGEDVRSIYRLNFRPKTSIANDDS